MPCYTYRCEGCARQAETTHAASEELTPVCRECGGIMRRVIVTPPTVTKTRHGQKKIDQLEDVAEDEKDHHGSACVLHYHPPDPESKHS